MSQWVCSFKICPHSLPAQRWSQWHAWILLLVIASCIAEGGSERPLGDDKVSEAVLRHVAQHVQHSREGNRNTSDATSFIGNAANQSVASANQTGDAAGHGKSSAHNSNTSYSQPNSSRVSAARKTPSDNESELIVELQGKPQDNDTMDFQFALDEQIANAESTKDVGWLKSLMALVGGTGATIGGTGNLELDQDLVRRMRYQDKAVMLLLLVMYFVTLGFSASFAYRQALNDSPVTFYADPRYHDIVSEGYDMDTFLEAFNQSPKDVQLQVSGFVPVPPGVLGSIEWQGEYYYDAFSFALDLSPWVVRDGTSYSSESEGAVGQDSHIAGDRLIEGIVYQDLQDLRDHIRHNRNDLSIIDLRKEVSWPNWEELATNIKYRIRQSGFSGIITVHRTERDSVTIYKNTPWANFMHSRTTKVLCALSVLGWMFYLPYMWLRCTCSCIRSRYVIDVSIDTYWPLIADKLSADGFVEQATTEDRNREPAGHDSTNGENTAAATAATQGNWIPQSEFVRFNSISFGDAGAPGPMESTTTLHNF